MSDEHSAGAGDEWAREWAQAWIASWNEHDHAAILDHYAEILEYRSPLVMGRFPDSGGVIRDRQTLSEYVAIGLRNNPNLHFTLLDVYTGVDEITVVYENARGGKTAESFQFDDQRKVVRVASCYSPAV